MLPDVKLYKIALFVFILICFLATAVGGQEQEQESNDKCKLQQPVRSFKVLTNDTICRQPNPLPCKDGLIFVCAFHINGSLGAGCVERICLHGRSCPRFTKLRREETVIQEGSHDDDFCSSCNNSFYNIMDWKKYEECYKIRTTRKNNTMDKTTDEMNSSLKGWEVALIIVVSVVAFICVVTLAALWWKYRSFCGCIRSTEQHEKNKDRVTTQYSPVKYASNTVAGNLSDV